MKLFRDVKMEYSKVEWPRKKQVVHANCVGYCYECCIEHIFRGF